MMAKSFSFSIAREEECKFIDEWKVLVYSSKLDTFGTLKLKLFSIPKCDKVVPELTIYNLYPQPNLQFGIPNVYIKTITISGHHALIDTIDGYQFWNLLLEPAGQIPLPDCAPYMDMNTHVTHGGILWLLDTNKTSELLYVLLVLARTLRRTLSSCLLVSIRPNFFIAFYYLNMNIFIPYNLSTRILALG